MGGDIGVKSTLGQGSTFWFTLNLANAELAPSMPELKLTTDTLSNSQLEAGQAANDLPQFNARVLVVDDNAINQTVAQFQLEDFGVEVELTENGQEALLLLNQSAFDLVLMDCQMPVMDGFKATRLIRDSQSTVLDRTIPIIAMTANAIIGDREKCIAAGMDDYISKPVDTDKLEQALRKWLPKSEVI